MGAVNTAPALETAHFTAYRLVTLKGHDGPIMLACKGLRVGMSLQRYLEPKNADQDIEGRRDVGEVALGLRRDLGAVGDAIDALVQFYKAGGAVEPIKVLARREPNGHWSSTGWVVDGAIRVQAALEAGLAEMPVWLVTPHFEDTPLEGMYLHYNAAHGARLTLRERDAILHVLARRYMRDHTGDARRAIVFAIRLSERTGLATSLIEKVTHNDFQVRDPDQYAEATRLLKEGKTPAEIAKLPGMPSRAAIEKQARKLGIDYRRKAPAGGTHNGHTGAGASSAGDTRGGHAAGARPGAKAGQNGNAPDATPDLVLASRLMRTDARATARDLEAALNLPQVQKDAIDRAFLQIKDWILNEAEEYKTEQAKILWDVIERHSHWAELLHVNLALRIYRDRYLRERDLPVLRQMVASAESEAVGRPRRGRRASRRAGRSH